MFCCFIVTHKNEFININVSKNEVNARYNEVKTKKSFNLQKIHLTFRRSDDILLLADARDECYSGDEVG